MADLIAQALGSAKSGGGDSCGDDYGRLRRLEVDEGEVVHDANWRIQGSRLSTTPTSRSR
ncbi:hypothetical protein OsI_00231 [Oryza sativa Indica Group]|uniref:Uncharacterized protein n=1 Tax=Oryza sativa subsp. indica TaxID=39946 RepID=A2WK82_ORYSI|nr:hypothetical protein OsI_00231 [Oryza sativa Indica Group]